MSSSATQLRDSCLTSPSLGDVTVRNRTRWRPLFPLLIACGFLLGPEVLVSQEKNETSREGLVLGLSYGRLTAPTLLDSEAGQLPNIVTHWNLFGVGVGRSSRGGRLHTEIDLHITPSQFLGDGGQRTTTDGRIVDTGIYTGYFLAAARLRLALLPHLMGAAGLGAMGQFKTREAHASNVSGSSFQDEAVLGTWSVGADVRIGEKLLLGGQYLHTFGSDWTGGGGNEVLTSEPEWWATIIHLSLLP